MNQYDCSALVVIAICLLIYKLYKKPDQSLTSAYNKGIDDAVHELEVKIAAKRIMLKTVEQHPQVNLSEVLIKQDIELIDNLRHQIKNLKVKDE